MVEQKHVWKLDDLLWDCKSECFRCTKCGLTMLIYDTDDIFDPAVKCEGDNVGRFVTSKRDVD